MAEREDSLRGSTYRDDRPDSQRIRADIDRTRAEMDETFDALDSKLTPGQLLLEGWGLLKGGSGAGASRLMRLARQHPLPSLVIGAGVGWLLLEHSRESGRASSYDDRYGRYRRYRRDEGYGSEAYGAYGSTYDFESGEERGRLAATAENVAGTVKEAAGSVKEAASGAVHKVGDLAGQAGDKVGDFAGSVREGASHLGERTRHGARRARAGLWQKVEERPLSVGAATLALGVVAGLLIPSTEKENELLGETRDRLLEKAKEVGEEAVDKGKHVAQTAVDTLKQEAERQDLTPSGLAEKVRTVAKETAHAVKEEAKSQKLTPEGPAQGRQGQSRQGQSGGEQGADRPAGVQEPELVKR